ncbi:MAG: AEC family transporter, partial [Candidatus Pelagibacter sp.]|nr:AEC family transporter [Candidatus Pelagibacter sp.]
MDLYSKIFEVLFPVFFVIGIGYYLGKKNPKIDTNFITNFAGNIGTPGMIFYTVTTTGVTFAVFTSYFFYALIIIGGFSIVGLILLFFLKRDLSMELPPMILPNTGNMGIPICLFAYGTQGLGIASAIASVIILFHFTLGVFLAKKKFSFDVVLKSPPVYSII